MMAVYVVRGGSDGWNKGVGEKTALNGEYGLIMTLDRNVTDFSSYDELRDYIEKAHNVSTNKAATWASQTWRFVKEIGLDDLVVMPCQREGCPQAKGVAVGKMIGEYEYRPEYKTLGLIGPHTRKVRWWAIDIPRKKFDQDLQSVFDNVPLTIFQVRKDNAEDRISAVVDAYLDEITDDIVGQARDKFAGQPPDCMVINVLERVINRLSGYATPPS